jgi:hypothetical protein
MMFLSSEFVYREPGFFNSESNTYFVQPKRTIPA